MASPMDNPVDAVEILHSQEGVAQITAAYYKALLEQGLESAVAIPLTQTYMSTMLMIASQMPSQDD